MNLREIANKAVVLDGQLTLWMMPYLTLRNDVVLAAFEKVVSRDAWDTVHNTFVVCEGTLIDVEAADGAGVEARGFLHYWQARGDDINANWQLFTAVTGGKAYAALWEAYVNTRDTAFDAAEPLNAEGEPDPQPAGG